MAVGSTRNQKDKGQPVTPLFDESASARARPVEPIHLDAEPIHQNLFNAWRGRMSSLATLLGNQTRALAIVVVIGLITGAVGGLLLVNAAKANREAQLVDTLPNDPAANVSTNETQNLDAFASQLSTAAQSPRPVRRKAKGRFHSNKPRAYRVAIIR